jgi:flagellar basal-body rod protein FlgF
VGGAGVGQHLAKSRGGEQILGEKIAYVRDIATVRDLTAGGLEKTGNPLDLAISGDGYFVVETAAGERFTRNGRLRLDEAGQLVNQQGNAILSDGGQPFFFAPGNTEITVSRDGTITTANGALRKLRVVTFQNQQELTARAGGLYSSKFEPTDAESPDVVQGMHERSNVQPIIEMTKMISVSRSYESIRRLIEREDERIKTMVEEMARPI